MLSNTHFYHRTIRRNVIAFGNMFNDITMVKYKKNTYDEVERLKVPLSYAGKENYISRFLRDPDLKGTVQVVLPRMSFEMTGITYDPSRKLSNYSNQFDKIAGNIGSVSVVPSGTPYNLDFELNIYVRNVEDGTQIVEQILPYFNPDYTLSMFFLDNPAVKRDVPIILNSVSYMPSYEGDEETARMLIWTLNFTVKTYFFGNVSNAKIIRKAVANTYYLEQPSDGTPKVFSMAATGTGDYKLGEAVYQGQNLPDSTASAVVYDWNAGSKHLTIQYVNGNFVVNNAIKGADTGASYVLDSIDESAVQLIHYTVEPDPIDAELGDDFGFTETITEFPNI